MLIVPHYPKNICLSLPSRKLEILQTAVVIGLSCAEFVGVRFMRGNYIGVEVATVVLATLTLAPGAIEGVDVVRRGGTRVDCCLIDRGQAYECVDAEIEIGRWAGDGAPRSW